MAGSPTPPVDPQQAAAASPAGFDVATAGRRRSEEARTGVGTWDVDLHPSWRIGPKAHGGYLFATVARAGIAELAARGGTGLAPVAASAHFLRAPDPGPAAIEVDVGRTGRTASQVRARLLQDGVPCVDLLLTAGAVPDVPVWWGEVPAPDVAPFATLPRREADAVGAPFRLHLLDVVDQRIDPVRSGLVDGEAGGTADLVGWTALADGRPHDPLSLLLVADCLPPAVFGLGIDGWVPTLELTAYVRARPAPGPVVVRQRAQIVQGDRVDEVCEVWDARGVLVCQATQLAAVRTPEAPPGRPPA